MPSFALRSALALLIVCGLAASARADDANAPDETKPRREVGGHLWGISLASSLDTAQGELPSLHVSFQDLLKHLSGGMMANARADVGEWSFDFDGTWAKLRGDNQSKTIRLGPRGGLDFGAELKSEMSLWILELNAGHQLFKLGSLFSRSDSDTRHVTGEIYVGARYWAFDPKFQVAVATPTRNLSVRIGDRTDWVDPTIGLRFGIDLSKTTAMHITGDVGGFNIGNWCSDFSWEQVTSISWEFAEDWKTNIGYKFLDFHRDVNDVNARVQLRGPFIALSYTF
ncbi:MAG: hypothetical protein ACHQ6T_04970 [Myxococcota bacterium]